MLFRNLIPQRDSFVKVLPAGRRQPFRTRAWSFAPFPPRVPPMQEPPPAVIVFLGRGLPEGTLYRR